MTNKWDSSHRIIVKDNRNGSWSSIFSRRPHFEQIDILDHKSDRISSISVRATSNTSTQPPCPPQNSALTPLCASYADRCIRVNKTVDTRRPWCRRLDRRRHCILNIWIKGVVLSMVVHGMDLQGISGGEFYPGTSISIVWNTGSRELLRTVCTVCTIVTHFDNLPSHLRTKCHI